MAIRDTQNPLEIPVLKPSNDRVTQVALEIAAVGTSHVRATQLPIEIVCDAPVPVGASKQGVYFVVC